MEGGENKAGRHASRRKASVFKRIMVMLLCAVALASEVTIVVLLSRAKDLINDPNQAFKPQTQETVNSETQQDADITEGKEVRETINILLLGIDSNAEREAKNYGYRSDVMMLCTVDFEDGSVYLTSVPRDMWVEVPRKMDDAGNITKWTSQRINTAYSYGGGPKSKGAEFAMEAFQGFIELNGEYDVPVDYYVSIDMDGIYKLADDVGGVEVVLDRNISGVGKKGETVIITSANIDPYVRTRKQAGDDFGRAARQQTYIMGIAKKIMEMDGMEAVTKLYGTIVKYTKTNMSLEQFIAIAGFLMEDFDLENMESHTVMGIGYKTDAGADVLKVDEEDLREWNNKVFG